VELDKTKKWLGEERLAVIFDGTTRDGELFCVVGRIINSVTFLPEQRVLAMKLYERSKGALATSGEPMAASSVDWSSCSNACVCSTLSQFMMGIEATDVQKLAAAFLVLGNDPARMQRVIEELPRYKALCQAVRLPPVPTEPKSPTPQKHRDECVARFYADNVDKVPEFCSLFRDAALVTASSAAAERVFSKFNNTFGDQQMSAKEDLIETAMMLQYSELTWYSRPASV
jgi:hypothetical protein